MSPVVIKSSRSLLQPHGETPTGKIPLSCIDKLPIYRRLVDFVQVFKHGYHAAEVIRKALSRALNNYYPLAGRLLETKDGELQVACTGEGIWFVEASADCSLEDVNYFEHPLLISKEDILPYPRPGLDPEDALVMIQEPPAKPYFLYTQVTQFTCGGFIVGGIATHVLSDVFGHGLFLNAAGEMARNLAQPTVMPIWSRELIPCPPQPQMVLPPLPTRSSFELAIIDISLDKINQLKSTCPATNGRSCTTFEVLGAKLWQCWTQAVGHDPELRLQFGFPVNLRPMLGNVLPQGGYYGNCFHAASAKESSGNIVVSSMSDVVNLIRDAKDRVPSEFLNWIKGDSEVVSDPHSPNSATVGDMLAVIDWRRSGHSEVDFGWGVPISWGPLTSNGNPFSLCVIVNPPDPKQGVRLWTQMVSKETLEAFKDKLLS